MTTTNKRDEYRKLLEKISKHIRTYGNMEDVDCGNTMNLCVSYGSNITAFIRKFEKIKSEK